MMNLSTVQKAIEGDDVSKWDAELPFIDPMVFAYVGCASMNSPRARCKGCESILVVSCEQCLCYDVEARDQSDIKY